MTLPYRRPGLLVAAGLAVLASLLAPVTAFAAVANETTLTVTFVDGVTLLSVDRAAVHVTVHQDGAVIAEVDGETDAAGISVLINLPHETGEGGVVTLDVTAHKESSFTDSETGCVTNDSWDASRTGVQVDDVALAVEFTADEQQAVSSIECPPAQPSPTGEVAGAVGTPGPTLPPTDTVGPGGAAGSGAAIVVAALIGLAAGGLFLVRVPRRRRAEVRVERRVRR